MTKEPFFCLAIDGGAASGKSSTARGVAEALNLLHVDTGSHYRALTFACLESGIDPLDTKRLDSFLHHLRLGTKVVGRSGRMLLNGNILGEEELKSSGVNAMVSRFASQPAIRARLRDYQRSQAVTADEAGFPGIVMEGRDIGTVIFPRADLKIFLEADAGTRQARRLREGQEDAIAERDRLDSSRKTAPLQAADDAVLIDNSAMSLEGVVAEVVRRAREKMGP